MVVLMCTQTCTNQSGALLGTPQQAVGLDSHDGGEVCSEAHIAGYVLCNVSEKRQWREQPTHRCILPLCTNDNKRLNPWVARQ